MEFRNIVAGVDFSPSSIEALRILRLLASSGDRVLMVHATEVRPFDLVNAAAAVEAERLHEELAARARRSLEGLAVTLSSVGLVPSFEVGSGRAVDEIVARSHDADLVVVGSHGHSMLGRITLGSTAEELVRRSAVPTLVARGTAPERFARIVLALDPLGPARDAIRAAASIARRTSARLEALHSVHFPAVMPSASISNLSTEDDPAFARAREVLEHHVTSVPERIKKLVREVAGCEAHVQVFLGRPGDEIPRHLNADDLLVCGTHGRTGAARFFFGSVAGKLVRNAPCSLLVIPSVEGSGRLPKAASQPENPIAPLCP